MRLTMHENTILNAIAESYPVKSSYAKLVKLTGKARNDIDEIVLALKAVGFVNVTTDKEIYLLEDGRKHLGIDSNKTQTVRIPSAKPEQQKKSASEVCTAMHTDNNTRANRVAAQLRVLDEQLNKQSIEISDNELKGQTLARLAELMADDIAALLLEIKSDLERVCTE